MRTIGTDSRVNIVETSSRAIVKVNCITLYIINDWSYEYLGNFLKLISKKNGDVKLT